MKCIILFTKLTYNFCKLTYIYAMKDWNALTQMLSYETKKLEDTC